MRHVKLRQTDWRKVMEYVDREEEREREVELGRRKATVYRCTGEGYKELRDLIKNEWTREVDICDRSKRWWNREFKELRKKAVKNKEARKELKRKIKEAKAKCWKDWVEERRDVWQIARVARNPFQLKKRCHALELEDGSVVHEDDHEGKCRAFVEHNVIHGHCEPTRVSRRTERVTPTERTMERIHRGLKKTKS